MAVPEGLVSDSERAYFSVIGDLLGPTMQVRDTSRCVSSTEAGVDDGRFIDEI